MITSAIRPIVPSKNPPFVAANRPAIAPRMNASTVPHSASATVFRAP